MNYVMLAKLHYTAQVSQRNVIAPLIRYTWIAMHMPNMSIIYNLKLRTIILGLFDPSYF